MTISDSERAEARAKYAGAVSAARRMMEPFRLAWERDLQDGVDEAHDLVEELLAGTDPMHALAAMFKRRKDDRRLRDELIRASVVDDDGAAQDALDAEKARPSLNTSGLWRQVWFAWDAQRPDRDGLTNPMLPETRYSWDDEPSKGGAWHVAEHLLDELDEWHPSAELGLIGSDDPNHARSIRMRGDAVQGVLLKVANANLGRLKPERATGPVRYRLVRSDELPGPTTRISYERGAGFVAGELEEHRSWGESHLVPISERLRRMNKR